MDDGFRTGALYRPRKYIDSIISLFHLMAKSIAKYGKNIQDNHLRLQERGCVQDLTAKCQTFVGILQIKNRTTSRYKAVDLTSFIAKTFFG